MKNITIHRPKESFNKNFSYKILVGNRILTELKNGEEKIIEIPDENESIKAKIQWCGSEKMELRNLSESDRIIVNGNKFLNKILLFSGSILPIIGLMMFSYGLISKNLGTGIIVLFVIGIIGTLTIGKNKWLRLKKE
ncbi:hypothetical protein [Ancylomarina sp. 16SWW S1-10-2]|uniref:hypothetical protein n=1 Tax=Ancylomarina sp. 16SWW S1-10-2 TaxID=2499681 RepID=UPI0012AD3E9D|nr:hypothetical protein [Ancylomarina sp. 16SWW S1-10-2]MRT91719.1 hypothetical protein [Ancylomarina sp. 16SWW S1-10-2]